MRVDIGNCLASVATPGIARDNLDRLDPHVAAAHERIEARRAEGAFGYAALDLPETTDPGAIHAAADAVPDAQTVLTVGIGGSALGAKTLTAGLGTGHGHHVALDNLDPTYSTPVLEHLDLESTVLHVVSRSGTTVETVVNFLLARSAMEAAGVDWAERTVVTTGTSGPLRSLAETHDLPVLAVPEGVPGRFSVLSAMGLVPAAIAGVDVEALLVGGDEDDVRRVLGHGGPLDGRPENPTAAGSRPPSGRWPPAPRLAPFGRL
jgi:glucose-6-phosphate isomerase